MVYSRSKEVGYRNVVGLMLTELNYTFFGAFRTKILKMGSLLLSCLSACNDIQVLNLFPDILYYGLSRNHVYKFHCCLKSDNYNRRFSYILMLVIAGNSSLLTKYLTDLSTFSTKFVGNKAMDISCPIHITP